MPQQCNNMAGHVDCARAIFRSSRGKEHGCPGGCTACISRYKSHPEAIPDRAVMFMEDPAMALRYIGHHKNERSKRKMAR